MKQKIAVSSMTLVLLMLALMFTQTAPVSAWTSDDGVFDDFGPKVDNYILNMYATTDLLMGALQAGEVDTADWEIPAAWAEAWSEDPYNDPNDRDYIKMQPVKSVGQREFDLNHKQFIDTYPGFTNPMTYQKFRQAIAHLTNKPEYVTEILKGYAVVLGTPIMPWTVWYNDACSDYYTYSMALARAALDDSDFEQGATGPLVEGGDNVRTYPAGHEKAGADLDPLILYIRADDPDRMEAGKRIAAKLKMVGIPTTDNILPMSGCYTPVFVNQDYHLYTGGWSLSFDPDYLYDLYGGHAINWPNYGYYNNSDFNEAAAHVKYAVTYEEALYYAKEAQWIMTVDVGYIPLWTAVAQTAHRGYANRDTGKPWEGFVNAEGVGLPNAASYMNAHTGDVATGGALTCGQKEVPLKLNFMRSEWVYEYSILLRIYDFLLSADPYTIEDMPWLAHSWNVGTYYNTVLEKECSMLTFNLEDNVYWHDGVHFTSADVKFSLEYYKENQGWWWGNVMDVYDVATPDDYTVVVLMSVKSFWALHWIGLGVPMFPKHIWETITGDAIDGDMPDPYLIGTGPFKYEGGEPGTEPGTGVIPKEYVKFSAYNAKFFRFCPINAAGGIDLQGNYAYPAKNAMKRTVYGPEDKLGEVKHPALNTIVPRIKCKNRHATTEDSVTVTWTLTTTGYSDAETITVESNPHALPVTMTFDTFDISADANGALPYTFSASHTADPETGRACSYTQDTLVKTFIGDIDGDLDIDLFDTLELNSGIVLDKNGEIYYANADISGDGVVDVYDTIEMSISL